MNFQPPKGTRDCYPEEMFVRNYIFDQWRKTAHAFGFEEYDGPLFEHLELFTQKSGEEIVKQLYHFQDKGGRDLALRPEITPTLARMVNQKGASLRHPLRWFSIPRLFRYERMQKGRLREFFQFNLDILGMDNLSADAELIAAAVSMLRSFGLLDSDFSVHISSRKLMQEILRTIGVSSGENAKYLSVMDHHAKAQPEEYKSMLREAGLNEAQVQRLTGIQAASSLGQIQNLLEGGECQALAELKNLFDCLAYYGIEKACCFDPAIVRGLAYYTGIVYEIYFCGEDLRAIAGGGRYDHLTEALGGKYCPATGFAMGDVVLEEVLRQKSLLPKDKTQATCYLIAIGEKARQKAIELSQTLRSNSVSTLFSLEDEPVKRQFRRADEAGCQWAAIIGEDEMARNEVRLKNMKTGDERSISESQVLENLKT